MFNPYNCRPVGSRRFEEHLKDVQASQWYASEFMGDREENLYRLCENSHKPWHQEDAKEDPWTNLVVAIVIDALLDYLDEYEKKIKTDSNRPSYWIHESHCISLENDYFRKGGPMLEMLFDKMLKHVCWQGIDEIRKCKKRLMLMNGWIRRPDSSKKTREERMAEKQAAAEERFRQLFMQLEKDFPEDDYYI